MANWIKKIFLLTKPSLDTPTNPDTPTEEYPELIDDYSFTESTKTGTNANWVAKNGGTLKFISNCIAIKGANVEAVYTISKNIAHGVNYQLKVEYHVNAGNETRVAKFGVREFKDNILLATNEFSSNAEDKPYSITFKSNENTNKFEVYIAPIGTLATSIGSAESISFKRV